jgi:hypothetical protein
MPQLCKGCSTASFVGEDGWCPACAGLRKKYAAGPAPCGSDFPGLHLLPHRSLNWFPPTRHPNSARFHEILAELGALHDRKQQDYGRGDDPFYNIRASQNWGVKPWVGAMVRLSDKIQRLQSLIANGKLANESAEDSLRDIPVYGIIALVLFEQEEKRGSK